MSANVYLFAQLYHYKLITKFVIDTAFRMLYISVSDAYCIRDSAHKENEKSIIFGSYGSDYGIICPG